MNFSLSFKEVVRWIQNKKRTVTTLTKGRIEASLRRRRSEKMTDRIEMPEVLTRMASLMPGATVEGIWAQLSPHLNTIEKAQAFQDAASKFIADNHGKLSDQELATGAMNAGGAALGKDRPQNPRITEAERLLQMGVDSGILRRV